MIHLDHWKFLEFDGLKASTNNISARDLVKDEYIYVCRLSS